MRDHLTRNAGIAAYDNLAGVVFTGLCSQCGVSCDRFDNVERTEGVTRLAADRATEA